MFEYLNLNMRNNETDYFTTHGSFYIDEIEINHGIRYQFINNHVKNKIQSYKILKTI